MSTTKMAMSKVIYNFTSRKGNQVYKLVTKTFDNATGEIVDNQTLISEEMSNVLNETYGIEIISMQYDEVERKLVRVTEK